MITSIAEDLWGVDAPFRVYGIRLGARMTVIRCGGELCLHSPVPIDDETRTELDRLGSVRWIVAPSKVHHLFVAPALATYPGAELLGAPGLAEKRRDLTFSAELGDASPRAWSPNIEQCLVRGAPLMNEVLFFHRPSRTLIVTDIAFNIPSADHAWTRTYLKMMGAYGGFGQSRMVKLCVRDRAAVKESIESALAWDFDRVVVTHGETLETGGKDALRALFAWL